jgi:hypothetical protein
MRIYEGSPRQDFEEVFRSIGADLDARGLHDILVLEIPDGFIVQGVAVSGADGGAWSESMGTMTKRTISFSDEDIPRFMDEALARRNAPGATPATASSHEAALRVIGRWIDERRPRDVFVLEQQGAYIVRLLIAHANGMRHELDEFTREDVAALIAAAPTHRAGKAPSGS